MNRSHSGQEYRWGGGRGRTEPHITTKLSSWPDEDEPAKATEKYWSWRKIRKKHHRCQKKSVSERRKRIGQVEIIVKNIFSSLEGKEVLHISSREWEWKLDRPNADPCFTKHCCKRCQKNGAKCGKQRREVKRGDCLLKDGKYMLTTQEITCTITRSEHMRVEVWEELCSGVFSCFWKDSVSKRKGGGARDSECRSRVFEKRWDRVWRMEVRSGDTPSPGTRGNAGEWYRWVRSETWQKKDVRICKFLMASISSVTQEANHQWARSWQWTGAEAGGASSRCGERSFPWEICCPSSQVCSQAC